MTYNVKLIDDIKNIGCHIETDVCLAPYTSFKIGGNCKYLVKPNSFTQIQQVVCCIKNNATDYYFLGNGSNVLVSDEGYDGVIVLITNSLSSINLIDETTIECDAGTTLTKLCHFALDNSLSGLEFAFGIPGTVGGAIYMNAGAYGGEIKDIIKSCTYLNENNEICNMGADELNLSYRNSVFNDTNCCILKGAFSLLKSNKQQIKEKMDDYISRRKSKQPLEYPSAGSTFKRPEGNYASALIEQCGLKGYTVGGAMVSDKHSGFIVNKENATCKDILTLVSYVKEDVYKKTGYTLEIEIKTLGL